MLMDSIIHKPPKQIMEEVNYDSDIDCKDKEFDYKPPSKSLRSKFQTRKQHNRDKYIKGII